MFHYNTGARTGFGFLVFVFWFTVVGVDRETHAQVTAAAYNGPGDFAYDVQSMPDLDQKRLGLGGMTNGDMYCVPTACMNLCAFAANFGFPGLDPEPGIWEGPVDHQVMTNHLNLMGSLFFMRTDVNDGTDGSDKIEGLTKWIEESAQPLCIVSAYPNDDGYWPTIDRATLHAASGAIVQLSYGRYEWSDLGGQAYLTERQGGHAVTLKLAYANNASETGPRLIHYRDPATDDGDLNSNSEFSSKWPTSAANIQIGTGIYGTAQDYVVTSITNPPSGNYQIFDSYLALYPGGGLSYSGVQINGIFVNDSLGFVQSQQPVPFDVGQVQADRLVSAIPHPLNHSSLALVHIPNSQGQERTELYQASHRGRFDHLLNLPADTRCLALGFGHTVYAATDSNLIELTVIGGRATIKSTHRIPGGPRETTNAIAYDDVSNLVIVARGNAMHVIDPTTTLGSWSYKIRGLREGPNPIRSLVVWDQWLIAATQNDGIAEAELSGYRRTSDIKFNPLALPGVSDTSNAAVDSFGRLYVSDRRGLMEFEYDKRRGWLPVLKPYYKGANFVGRSFVPFTNRTNIRRGDLQRSQWYNISPKELENVGPDVPD